MSIYENIRKIDDTIVFFDNQNVPYEKVDKGLSLLDNKDKSKITNSINCLDDSNTIQINLFVGINSSYLNNKIISNDEELINKQDIVETIFFNDSESYKGKKIEKSIFTSIFKKTLGLESHDQLFQEISKKPFSDEENIENARLFLEMPNEIKYPKYYNAYSLNRLNSNISVFGTLESINGENTTEKSLRGIICEIIKNGTDARDRSIEITNSITLREFNSPNQIESYSDEEYEEVILNDDVLLTGSFKYTNRIINGNVMTVLDTSSGASSPISVLSNKVIFYTEDDSNIVAFDDRLRSEIVDSDYGNDEIFYSTGQSIDMSEGESVDSVGFLGELN